MDHYLWCSHIKPTMKTHLVFLFIYLFSHVNSYWFTTEICKYSSDGTNEDAAFLYPKGLNYHANSDQILVADSGNFRLVGINKYGAVRARLISILVCVTK